MNKTLGAPREAPSQTLTWSNTCHDQLLPSRVGEEPATFTHPDDQIGYVSPLKLTVSHSDHELHQVWRDENRAIYQHFRSHGQFIGWEAILIKVKPATKIFGTVYPKREVYPGNENFGRYALSIGPQYDLEYVILKAKSLKVNKCRRENRLQPTGTGRRRTGTGTNTN